MRLIPLQSSMNLMLPLWIAIPAVRDFVNLFQLLLFELIPWTNLYIFKENKRWRGQNGNIQKEFITM